MKSILVTAACFSSPDLSHPYVRLPEVYFNLLQLAVVCQELCATWSWVEQGWSEPLPFPPCQGAVGRRVWELDLRSKPTRFLPNEEPPVGNLLRLSCLNGVECRGVNLLTSLKCSLIPRVRSLNAAMQCPVI